MKAIVFIGLLLFCGANAFTQASVSNASQSVSETVHTLKEVIDIKNEINSLRKPGKNKTRTRRYSLSGDASSTVNKVQAGLLSLFKTFAYQPIAHGNFLESTVRGYHMFTQDEGKFVFGTLEGELNRSFQSIMSDNPRTGDIISCRIPTNRYAEHYMMVLNGKIIEVAVNGGKDTSNGIIMFDSFRKSSYYNSTECLLHKNRVMERAIQIDERDGSDAESDNKLQEILHRVNCTINGKTPGNFEYDLMSCNCQDVVLYWSYGYVENDCVSKFFSTCETLLIRTVFQLSAYVDVTGHLKDNARQTEDAMRQGGIIGF